MRALINITIFFLCAGMIGAQALPQNPQLQIKGYAAADYAKSEEEGLVPDGSFGNPLFGLVFSGQLSQNVRFMAEASYYTDKTLDLNQAWVGVDMSQHFSLRLGLYLVPFGWYNERNLPHEQLYINFPLNIDFFVPLTWRDIGVAASGNALGLDYSAWFGNGLMESEGPDGGQQFKDNNANKGWGGRLLWAPDPSIGFGYSYYRGKYDDLNSRYRTMQAANAYWITDDFEWVFEYTYNTSENIPGYASGKGFGYYVHLAMVWKNIRPYASYQKLDYDDPLHGPGFEGPESPGDGISVKKTRWAVGAVFSLGPSVFLKFEYDFNRESEIQLKNDMYMVQIALSFQNE
ncbi:MAG: hypothetical protein GQ544_03335 [Candidatus Aminicenantes bacterium]|nr:hypothetical protein [Candidatus Aminicenantes bacterium]